MNDFEHIKVGDVVIRMVSGTIRMPLRVTKVHEGLIHCGPWVFDQATGIEEDPDLGFGVEYGISGSYLIPNSDA